MTNNCEATARMIFGYLDCDKPTGHADFHADRQHLDGQCISWTQNGPEPYIITVEPTDD